MRYWRACWGAVLLTAFACAPVADDNAVEVAPAWIEWGEKNPSWVDPFASFTIVDNIHYVGMAGLSSFLITSESGHILIDGGLPQNAPYILQNVEALGFAPTDIKTLLNSHAHFDHSGGLAEIKAVTGARLLASEGDRSALEGGFYLGAENDPLYFAPPVKVDQIIYNSDVIHLGDIALTLRETPGHSRGCSSFTMTVSIDSTPKDVLFFCSATVAGNRLHPEQYDGIVADYQQTFEITKDWRPDIFLANHPSFFNMQDKRARQIAGEPNPFVDADAFQKHRAWLVSDFERKLAETKAD